MKPPARALSRYRPIICHYIRFFLPVRVNLVIAKDVHIRSLSHKKEGRVGSVSFVKREPLNSSVLPF